MAKYIKKTNEGYAIDRFVQKDGIRLHVYKAGFETIADAKMAMGDEIERAFDMMRASRYGERTLRESSQAFFRLMSDRKAISTAYSIRKKLAKHFLSHFDMDGLTKKEITEGSVAKWYRWFGAQSEPRADTKNTQLSDVRKFMDFLWRKEKVISSEEYASIMGVLDNFKTSKAPAPEKAIWTEEQIKAFIGASPEGDPLRVMYSLLFYLGARIGEFLALTWDCIDWGNQTLRISKQMTKNGGMFVTSELKTSASYRECYLEDWVIDMLREYKEKENNKETAYLFHSRKYADGSKPMSFNDFKTIWNERERKLGLPHTTPHSARHRKATELAMLCRNEEEVKASAEFLGHSPSMMMDVYAHTTRQSIKNLMARKRQD